MYRPLLIMIACGLLLAGCAENTDPPPEAAPGEEAPTAAITGTAGYRALQPLPPGAVFEATLQDIARAGAEATVLGQTVISNPPPTIRFSIAYDPAALAEQGQYAVRATIRIGDRLLYTTDTVHPVLRDDGDTEVDLYLREVAAEPVLE